ncbi:MAG: SEC-C domain-containing protein [Myxococcales bacterium]|nr:SEC-C domain-containing protein [Myxococcales bacterium]
MPEDEPDGEILSLEEFYCVDPDCDCRQVVLRVLESSTGRCLATIVHAFDVAEDDLERDRTALEPLHDHSLDAPLILEVVEQLLEAGLGFSERLSDHYERVKEACRDPRDPIHARIRTLDHVRPPGLGRLQKALGLAPAPPKRPPALNAPCPCGSGRKYKGCCGRTRPGRS